MNTDRIVSHSRATANMTHDSSSAPYQRQDFAQSCKPRIFIWTPSNFRRESSRIQNWEIKTNRLVTFSLSQPWGNKLSTMQIFMGKEFVGNFSTSYRIIVPVGAFTKINCQVGISIIRFAKYPTFIFCISSKMHTSGGSMEAEKSSSLNLNHQFSMSSEEKLWVNISKYIQDVNRK